MQNMINNKNPSLQVLYATLGKTFGDGAFILEQDRGNPDFAAFTSPEDERVYIHVVTTGLPEGQYSVQVELYGPEHSTQVAVNEDGEALYMPFDLVVDSVVDLADLVGIFARYRRADTA